MKPSSTGMTTITPMATISRAIAPSVNMKLTSVRRMKLRPSPSL